MTPGDAEPLVLAERRFDAEDQRRFAALSGDFNPLHMDPVAARRTAAGACVVHGVAGLAWALELLASRLRFDRLMSIDADFARFLLVGEAATLRLVSSDEGGAVAELRTASGRIALYRLHFGTVGSAPVGPDHASGASVLSYGPDDTEPLAPDWPAVADASGAIPFFRGCVPEALAMAYPALCTALGAARVAALLSLTRLVGMVSPGLHSTFHRLAVQLPATSPGQAGRLHYRTVSADPRFATVSLAVAADGLSGRLRASRRAPPTVQPPCDALAGLLPAGRLAGRRVLVVGGSRGIGEVTAKLLGLAGAEIVVGYASGPNEAENVAADIRGAGGTANILRLDVSSPITPQLEALPGPLDSFYFFATPRIGGHPGACYSSELLHRYLRFYVDAFAELCAVLPVRSEAPLRVFYPSSVFVTEPARGMAEYAMAKAAGEALAADLQRFSPRVDVEVARLPRLPTDQTAGLFERDTVSIADCLLPILRRVEPELTA